MSAYLFYQIVHSDPNQREECLVHTGAYKRRASEALESCLALVNNSFITPIDREDIQLIASKLYQTTKVILKACVNLRIYKIESYNEIIKQQADLITTSAEELRKIGYAEPEKKKRTRRRSSGRSSRRWSRGHSVRLPGTWSSIHCSLLPEK